MKNNISITVFIVLVIVISVLFVTNNKSTLNNIPIKIGVILPLTGNAANYGEQVKSGLDIALKDVNKNGKKIDIVYEDNQFDPKLGLSAYNKLVKLQGIKYLITFGGNVCPYINPLAQRDQVVNFATGCNTLDFKDSFSYNFRFDVAESEASKAMVSYIKEVFKPKTVAMLYINNDWGTIVSKTIKDALVKNNITVNDEETFNDGSRDIRTQLAKIKNSNPDVIFFLSLSNLTPTLLKQVHELGIAKPLFTNISIQDPAVIKNTGDLAEGVLYSAPKLEQVDNVRNQSFDAVFPDPNSRNFASWGFDSIHLFADAFSSVGDNTQKVTNYLHQVRNYQGAFGLINYNDSGELTLSYAIKSIHGGKFIVLR